MFLFDSHCDTPTQLLRSRNLSADNRYGHVDIPKMRRGNVGASFFALYTPAALDTEEAYRLACAMIDATSSSVGENKADLAFATTAEQVHENSSKGLISILFGMENGSPAGESLETLEEFYDKGIRYVTLTHNGDNSIADSAAEGTRWGGLSPFGRDFVRKMNSLGMMVDLSHSSDATFYDCLDYSEYPIMASHSSCRSLCPHRRNLTDEMLRLIGECGGYVGINFYPAFLSDKFGSSRSDAAILDMADKAEAAFAEDPSDAVRKQVFEHACDRLLEIWRPGVQTVADHIEKALSLAGEDHVGIGTDFDGICVGPIGLEDISMMSALENELVSRGWPNGLIEKVFGTNLMAYFSKVCTK